MLEAMIAAPSRVRVRSAGVRSPTSVGESPVSLTCPSVGTMFGSLATRCPTPVESSLDVGSDRGRAAPGPEALIELCNWSPPVQIIGLDFDGERREG
jgi:hypothetical protein